VRARAKNGRDNQQRRTRKDLLAAAARLIKAGRTPAIDDVAKEAMVSRATAYRYFPSVDALLVEAPLDIAAPDARDFFANDNSRDVEDRLDRAEAALHEMIYANEPPLRIMLAHALTRAIGASAQDATPVRQNRRTPLIDAALAPARDRLDKAGYERLRAALSLVFGTEAMIVFRDVLPLDKRTAREVKRWMIRTLVRAALAASKAKA
jgi:AcrR family transcriptional regulator